jgi:hypothetical protein
MGREAVDKWWIKSSVRTVHRFSHRARCSYTPGLNLKKTFKINWLKVFSRKTAPTITTSF